MAEYRAVCEAADLPLGQARCFRVAGREIALFHLEGGFYAMENTCLHAGGPLAEGRIEGTRVVCPWHGWEFDVTTGRTPLNHVVGLTCFPVRLRGGKVEILA